MSGHTPGPWRAFVSNGVVAIIKGKKRNAREVIKWTGFDGSDFPKHAVANAFLIAAAPEMLAALKAALPHIDCSDSPGGCDGTQEECRHCDAIKLTRAAIAKAEGKS